MGMAATTRAQVGDPRLHNGAAMWGDDLRPEEKPSSPGSSRMDTTCGYGELVEAQYGCLHLQDGFRDGPVFLGWPHAVYGAAWLIQLGLLGALFEREKKGYGQRVTTSLMEGMAAVTIERFCTAEKL